MRPHTQVAVNSNRKDKIEIIVEKNDGLLWGRVEIADQLFTPYGETVELLVNNLKDLMKDYVQNEGKTIKFWENMDVENLKVDLKYDLEAFFLEHNYLKITAIAEQAGINPGLVRQYASGVKHPSSEQAKKIEIAIHKIAKELQEVSIYA